MKIFSKWIRLPSQLSRIGILGINHRNARFILPMNERKNYPRVDNKLYTKNLCRRAGIPVPEIFGIIQHHFQIKTFDAMINGLKQFVIKPSRGAAGRGVMVIFEHSRTHFTTADQQLTLSDITYHISSILSGLYSLGGKPDLAIVESCIISHPSFHDITIRGTPDIRVIVFNGAPIMAMLRLPTLKSRGKANLHQGAVAAGIDLSMGITLNGVWNNRFITSHPDTNHSIKGIHIPHWEEICGISKKLFSILHLGYFGVDFVIDKDAGPMVLEANVRLGLSIQIANRCGILSRIKEIDRLPSHPTPKE